MNDVPFDLISKKVTENFLANTGLKMALLIFKKPQDLKYPKCLELAP